MHRIEQDGEDWSALVTPDMGDKQVEEEEDIAKQPLAMMN